MARGGGLKKSCAVICGFFLFRYIPPHSDFAVLPSFVLKSQSRSQSEAWRVKRGLFVLCSQNTSFTDACSDFLRLHHLQAPDCCPPKAKLCLPWTCRWSRCADEKWSRCNRKVRSSGKLNLSPDWENCRMLRKFIFGKRHLILAHILVY